MGRRRRILIVEDDSAFRHCVAVFCAGHGFEVSEAGTLDEASRQLDARDFDAVLLDMNLPDGDGLSLLPSVGVERSLVISATPDPERFARDGVRHHLAKPVDLEDVVLRLDEIWPKEGRPREERPPDQKLNRN